MANLKTAVQVPRRAEDFANNPRGSIWHRWDPHIHAPGTILNNQFRGQDPWEDFLKSIETSSPTIRALGITDYYSVDLYERILDAKKAGRLTDVDLIFPNIELRFGIETAKGSPINAHLLVSPNDVNHVEEIKRFLNNLTFTVGGESYRCNDVDLKKLGRKHKADCANDRQALEVGANQFKINFDELRDAIKRSQWFQNNVLIAIAGSSRDGTAGLQEDSSFDALRVELERRSHIIFSANPKLINFWLGKGKASKLQLLEKWGGCKPCMHGSDAHGNDNVGKPDQDRFNWIKGDITFDSLKQAVIEPESRVFIGKEPPISSMPSYTMDRIEVKDAPWLKTQSIPLNAGLVAIIGARGSGKTALADLLAVGSHAMSQQVNNSSFVKRAKDKFKNESVSLQWLSGDTTGDSLKDYDVADLVEDAKIQYLSQQFVEKLCSSEGLTDELMKEIERVIFEAHSPADRMGTTSFSDLLKLKSASLQSTREMHEQQIKEYSDQLNNLREVKSRLQPLKNTVASTRKTIDNERRDRQALLGKSHDPQIDKDNDAVSNALDEVRLLLEAETRKAGALQSLRDNVISLEDTKLPDVWRQLKSKNMDAGLTEAQWESFQYKFSGDVKAILDEEIKIANRNIAAITGAEKSALDEDNLTASFLTEDVNLNKQTYNVLRAEQERLQKLMGMSQENSLRLKKLSEKIAKDESICVELEKNIKEAEEADGKIQLVSDQRRASYKAVFETLLRHEQILTVLYKPLMDNLVQEKGTLGKLTFHVQRIADLKRWAEKGESLLDLRKAEVFRGKGALQDVAEKELLSSWESGTADDVSKAIAQFLEKYKKALEEHSPVPSTDADKYRAWVSSVSAWIYGTDHISINYGVQYDGVNIQQLSPGTRGIVLLLLYLAIDKEDYRPLIIDQPEENLDPKSIFDELVPRFKAAKTRRQIIIVTHNANLVVNTDADQVILASCGTRKNQLPEISYISGGLENPEIRRNVCEILEGGEEAFKERAKRLRVILD